MEGIARLPSPIRFGIFEVDLQAGELRRQGLKVKLQEQPYQVLLVLLERPGEVVTREDLQKRLWSGDTFVDFERGLNRAINKLREALVDDADNPRFIETLPRRGYRFVAPVEKVSRWEADAPEGSRLLVVPPALSNNVENTLSTIAASRRQILPWVAAGVLTTIAVIPSWRLWRAHQIVTDQPLLQFDLDLGPDGFSQPAISADGMRIVFVSKGALAVRRLDQAKITRLSGTEGASFPFFSPNGRWVAYFAAGKLQKIAVEGGTPIALGIAPNAGGGSWGDDDSIVAALDVVEQGLSRIPAAGGVPQRLTDSKSDASGPLMHYWPQTLFGGKAVLFAATNGSAQGSLRVLTPKDGKVKTLVENSTHGRYIASGYLVYYQQGTLFAAPMDVGRLELAGPGVPLLYGVEHAGGFGRADFDVSSSGTLVYRGGTAGASFVLSWLYSSGKTEPLITKPGNYFTPRLSPDGRRLALSVTDGGKQNLWVYDISRETWSRLTSDADAVLLPTWTPDGEFLAFRSGNTLAWKRSDGTGNVERLEGIAANAGPSSFSADGKWLTFWPLQPGSDLWTVSVQRMPSLLRLGQPQLLLHGAGSKGAPAISPDGHWLAYTSNESGRFEIYVMTFSPQGNAAGGKWLVSNRGGAGPIWSPNGGELFYQSLDGHIQVAGYTVRDGRFVAEKPRVWSETRLGDTGIFAAFDVAPGGKRIVALFAADDPRSEALAHLLLNVGSELRRRTPTHGN